PPRHPVALVGREVSAVEAQQQQRPNVLLLNRSRRAAETIGVERQRLELPTAHPREFVELVQFAPLRGYPVPIPEQAELAVEALVVREPDQDFWEYRSPPPLLAGIAGLQRRVIRGAKRLDQIEHAMPEACFDATGTLIVGGVLRGELTDDRFESRVDAHQRLGLRWCDRPVSAGNRRDELERLALQLHRLSPR